MSNDKYIINIYKIITTEDKFKVFISSTKEKLSSLFLFYKKNCFTKSTNKLYEWIKPLDKSLLKIKIVKSYIVSSVTEQREREIYWIKKYRGFGYEVLCNEFEIIPSPKNKTKLYICINNTSIEEVTKKFGDRIISISKDDTNTKRIEPIKIPKIANKPIFNNPKKQTTNPTNYIDELKNILNKKKESNKSILELTTNNKKKKINFITQEDTLYSNFVDELKNKFKNFKD